ncbi:MAG: response regulator [Thermodesulfobacteriota bacterium]
MITRGSKRILVADDDKFFRVKLGDILTKAGHKIECVNDGRGVIEKLKNNRDGFDLLMLDLQMPEIDGYEVLEWMGDNNFIGRFPILAITGVYDPTHIFKRLKTLGAAGLITKALSPEQVIHKVSRLLFPDMEARGEPRVPISIPVDLIVEGIAVKGTLLNLSASGLFLHTMQELQIDTTIQLTFTIPGCDTMMKLNGVVKWYNDFSEEESFFGGAGIQFLNITSEEKEVLRQFVTRALSKLGLNE